MVEVRVSDIPQNLINTNLHRFLDGDFDDLYPLRGKYEAIDSIIQEYQERFLETERKNLHQVLTQQHKSIRLFPKQQSNIDALLTSDGFCVTTGQQIHPFLGPVFVWAKVQTTIQKSQELSEKTGKTVVPIFWMASEDHDFDEIKRIPFLGKEYVWEMDSSGPVGKLDTQGVAILFEQMKQDFAHDNRVLEYLNRFEGIYQKGRSLSEASRILIHQYFGESGLLIVDPNEPVWKEQVKDMWLRELQSESLDVLRSQAQKMKDLGLKVPITPRSTTLFYYHNQDRIRIDQLSDDRFQTADSNKQWQRKELQEEINAYPDRFSTNALLRPAYQQRVLPNLVYIGGPAECIYWLQVPTSIKWHRGIVPVLDLRWMISWIPNGIQKKLADFTYSWEAWFEPESELITRFLESEQGEFSLNKQIPALKEQFEQIWESLYQIKHLGLKTLKKQHEEVLKQLNQVQREFLETGLETHLAPKIKQIKQLKSTVFNEMKPAERTAFWIEWEFKIGEPISIPANSGPFLWLA